jgi:hypothetical protein
MFPLLLATQLLGYTSAPATISLNVTPPDAEVWIDGQRKNSVGPQRLYATHPVQCGLTFFHELEISWPNRRKVIVTVPFRAGETVYRTVELKTTESAVFVDNHLVASLPVGRVSESRSQAVDYPTLRVKVHPADTMLTARGLGVETDRIDKALRIIKGPALPLNEPYRFELTAIGGGRQAVIDEVVYSGMTTTRTLILTYDRASYDGQKINSVNTGRGATLLHEPGGIHSLDLGAGSWSQQREGKLTTNGGAPTRDAGLDSGAKPSVTFFWKPDQVAKGQAAMEWAKKHLDSSINVQGYEVNERNRWVVECFSLESDSEFQKTGFKVIAQGVQGEDGKALDLGAAYEPSPDKLSFAATRAKNENYKPGGGDPISWIEANDPNGWMTAGLMCVPLGFLLSAILVLLAVNNRG